MADLQPSFFRQLLRLKLSVSPPTLFAELAEVPWEGTWWSQVLRFLQQLAQLSNDSLHAEILKDNMHDAQSDPHCGNWAAGVQKKYIELGMPAPFSSGRLQPVNGPVFRQRLGQQYKSVWAGLHISPRTAPSSGAKKCTYLRWFARPGKMPAEPY